MKGKLQLDSKKIRVLYTSIILIIQSILLGISMLMLTVIPSDFNLIKVLLSDIRIVILNTVPILFVLLILYFVLNRVWVSFLLTSIIFMVIAEANRFKLIFRDDPLVFKDILLLKEAKEMTERYNLFLDKASLCIGIVLICITIISALFVKVKIENRLIRGGGSIVALLFLGVLFYGVYFHNDTLYDSLWNWQFGNQWKTANQYMSRGVVYSFLHSIPEAFSLPPEGYDEERAEEILADYETVDMPEDKKINIISIMLEAYCDLSIYDSVDFVIDPYQNFHELQSESYWGDLYTNIFAAGTITTERSFLTGYGNPDIDAVPTESYVRYFKEQGYYTEAMHPCYGWFYDRKNINSCLGFDNFDYYENTYSLIDEDTLQKNTYSGFLRDYDFFDYIWKGFEEAKQNKTKYFNFSVTYQNHGPYPSESGGMEYVSWKDGYTEAEYNILNNYLSEIASTDEAIGHLYEYISQEDEPVVLIMFGDHKPWLGDNNSVYEMLDIDFDMDTVEGGENYYETPYVLYANDAAKQAIGKDFEGKGNTISPMFLMNELFEYMGIEGPQYLNYLADVKKQYEVINTVYVGKNEKYELRDEKEDEKILQEEAWVEYYVKNRR